MVLIYCVQFKCERVACSLCGLGAEYGDSSCREADTAIFFVVLAAEFISHDAIVCADDVQ